MSDEKKELALVTLPAEKVDLEVALLNDKFIDELIDNVRKTAGSVVGDLKTTKGRGVYITMADQVRKSKTAFEVRAKELVAELKARPALIDANRKKFRDEMDKIAVEIRKPVTEYEAEQERLKQVEEAKKKAEQLAAEIEVAHEMALLMNDAFDRDAKAKADEVERLRKAHEEFIAQQAAEKAKREVEEKAKRDIEAAEQRERDAKLAQERAEQKAEQDKKDAATKAEREKQEAIAAEKLKAQQEAERVQREAKQKEDARLAEEKRVADEAAKRAANEKHRKAVGTEIVAALLGRTSITREQAIEVLIALKDEEIPHTRISY
ncbi:hypothetical protein [Yersinia mollaretii]|uniref:Cell envelope biogenesis protein TolA n=1 Tax=Yersinia mollaretii TaxID=33060 RepID=A0AA36LPB9_YERMO|nr:hypothetical protein [Yersinia mollaretii]CNI13315.1 Uncharacterised protein [Yersinia mollaretii]